MQIESELTILLAHQDSDERVLLVAGLKAQGYEVIISDGEADALKIVGSTSINGVIAHFNIPEFDGVALMEKIKKIDSNIPCLILSDEKDISIEGAFDRGAEAVFFSHMSKEILYMALRRQMSPKRLVSLRQFGREHFEKDVRLNVSLSSNTIINVGKGGMFVAASKEELPSIGSTVEFSFDYQLEKIVTIEGSGVVRWIRKEAISALEPVGYGIEFVGFSEGSRGELFKILNSLTTMAYIPKGKGAV